MNTDVLKELVDAVDEHKAIFERGDPIPLREAAWNDMARAAQNAAPSIKSLLSQEAELENLANRMGTAATVNGHDEHAQEVLRAFRDELRALIRRRHEKG